MAQSSVSAREKALEEDLGILLFDPGRGRAKPAAKAARLDRMVVTHIEERLLGPERIEDVLASSTHQRLTGAAVREIGERSPHPTAAWKGRLSAGTRPCLCPACRGRG
nr:hypothetical protein [Aurantiacibacter xanthus]